MNTLRFTSLLSSSHLLCTIRQAQRIASGRAPGNSLRAALLRGFLPFLILLLLPTIRVSAQNIGVDLERVVRLTPEAREAGKANHNPALDTIVMTLAYYAGMPDLKRVEELFNGPALLAHYAGNPAIRGYLLKEQLDIMLEAYAPPADLELPAIVATAARNAFLQKLPGAELFSRNGQIDLGKIHETFAAPPTEGPSLKAAAGMANDKPLGLSTANLVGSALAGLSDWISRRAQEELTYTFLTKLREDINRNGLNDLFPNTSEFLPTLDLLNYKAILPSIRKAFVEDLNAIAYNLGNFLDGRNAATFRDPAVYNIFLIYRILDLEMRDVPLADILAFTYGELERTRIDTRCRIDLKMTKVDTTNEGYRAILNTFDNLIIATDTLNARFEKAKNQLSDQQFNPLLDDLENAQLKDDVFDRVLDRIDAAFLPVDGARLALKNNYWEVGANPPATGIVQAWLRGREAYEFYEAYPSLTRYDELFGPNANRLAPDQLRAAGLTAVREVLAHRDELSSYDTQLSDLLNAREELVNIQLAIVQEKDADNQRSLSFTAAREELQKDLDAEMAGRDAPALRMLRKLTEEIPAGTKGDRERLEAVRSRFVAWVAEEGSSSSPFAAKLRQTPRQAAYFPPLQLAIDDATLAYDELFAAVETYSANQADSLIRAYHNLSTFETIFGLAQQVFFLLSNSDQEQLFAGNRQLSTFQTNASTRTLFAGIGRERLSRVPDLGQFSTTGVTDFLLDFGLFLSDFQSSYVAADLDMLDDKARRRVQAVRFITKTVQSLLEAPILNTGNADDPPISLAVKFPAFADVPEISDNLNEMFRLSQTGEFRYAIDNLLNLLRLFEVAPTASKKQQRLTERRDKLRNLVEDYVVVADQDLKAVGLAAPLADNLPMLGDNRDQATLARYQAELNTPGIDTYARQEATNSIRDLKIRRIQEELLAVQARIDKLDPKRTDRFREKLFSYGTFMADVAASSTPADFEAAISSVALPVGSSQIKRSRPSSIELGAYFGAALNREQLVLPPGVDAPELEEASLGASLFVPVGFSYSRNIGGNKSITFFGSLLDLGALTAFRLGGRNDDPDGASVDRLPEFRPANVIAPGLHVMYNFPKSPFTLGIGVQDGPSVRKFTLEGSSLQREARSVRGMVTLSVDVPIFRFFNK
jgi:hypothetical protein